MADSVRFPSPCSFVFSRWGPRQPVVETLTTALRTGLPSQHHAEASGPRVCGGHKTLPLSTAYRRGKNPLAGYYHSSYSCFLYEEWCNALRKGKFCRNTNAFVPNE